MAKSKTAAFVYDAEGNLVSTNPAHLDILGRSKDEALGRNLRDWTSAVHLKSAEETFLKCVAGEPVHFVRHITQPDGTIVDAHCQIFATEQSSGTLVVGTMRLIEVKAIVSQAKTFDIVDYVSDIAFELARISEAPGLSKLEEHLQDAASEAARIAYVLNSARPRRAN